MDPDPKRVAAWTIMIVVPLVVGITLLKGLSLIPPESAAKIMEDHFAAVVGLPIAGLVSAFVVVGLRYSTGPFKFKGFGFEFEGAAGQAILWVICFVAMSAMNRLLWRVG